MKITSNRKFAAIFWCSVLVTGASVFPLFAHTEISGETWGYWAFARIFTESGTFIIPDRSPVYTLYLIPFRMLAYPWNAVTEYLITTLIFSSVFLIFMRPYIGLFPSLFSVLYWLPFLAVAEPPNQKLALAVTLVALLFRRRFHRWYGMSYLFSGFAWLLRSSFLVFLGVFFVWDILVILHRFFLKIDLNKLPRAIDWLWPVCILIAFYLLIRIFQSPHPWNNVWFATAQWFPSDGKSLNRSLQMFNETYIWQTYGTFEGQDIYHTNKIAFGNAQSTWEAIRVNPDFFRAFFRKTFHEGISMVNNITSVPSFVPMFHSNLYARIILFVFLFLGSTAWLGDRKILQYYLGALLMSILTFTINQSFRYYVFMIPVVTLGAYGYSRMLVGSMYIWFDRVFGNSKIRELHNSHKSVAFYTGIFVFLVFSSGATARVNEGNQGYTWPNLFKTILHDWRKNDLKILDSRDPSFWSPRIMPNTPELVKIAPRCRGIMTLESTLLAGFTDIPMEKIYDIWEIPPFGHLGDGVYTGLSPNRIDCIYASKKLMHAPGGGTNTQIRYQEYILPYTEHLVSLGAERRTIEGYGEVITLRQ